MSRSSSRRLAGGLAASLICTSAVPADNGTSRTAIPDFGASTGYGRAQLRRVFMNVPHSAHVKPSWYGESVGHYEDGDTLVVDTSAWRDF